MEEQIRSILSMLASDVKRRTEIMNMDNNNDWLDSETKKERRRDNNNRIDEGVEGRLRMIMNVINKVSPPR